MLLEDDPAHVGHDTRPTLVGPTDDRPGVVLLVRCWLEPRQEGEPVVRGYIRDVRNGRKVAISDLEAVEQHLRRELHAPAQEAEGGRERSV